MQIVIWAKQKDSLFNDVIARDTSKHIDSFKVTNLYITDIEHKFVFDEVLKLSRPKHFQKPLIFRAYTKCPDLCPVKNLLNYKDKQDNQIQNFLFSQQNHLSHCQGMQLPGGLRIQWRRPI